MTSSPHPVLAPAPRKRRTWLIVLVSVGVLTLAVCGFGLTRLFLNLKHVTDTEKEINAVTAAFIEDSRDGLSQAGWDGLCAEAKERYSQQELAAAPKAGDVITSFAITATDVNYPRGQATVTVDLDRADGSTSNEVYIVDEEAGRWRMCEIQNL